MKNIIISKLFINSKKCKKIESLEKIINHLIFYSYLWYLNYKNNKYKSENINKIKIICC
jgi:hypothetical protein